MNTNVPYPPVGWRFMEVGEVKQEGDKFWSLYKEWCETNEMGMKVGDPKGGKFPYITQRPKMENKINKFAIECKNTCEWSVIQQFLLNNGCRWCINDPDVKPTTLPYCIKVTDKILTQASKDQTEGIKDFYTITDLDKIEQLLKMPKEEIKAGDLVKYIGPYKSDAYNTDD